MPFVRPLIVCEVDVLLTSKSDQMVPLNEYWYFTVVLPVLVPAVKFKVRLPSPRATEIPVGAPGATSGFKAPDEAEATLFPIALVATTLNV